MDKFEYETLCQFCTPRQREYLDAYYKCGSERKAAAMFGVNKTNVHQAMKRIRRKAAAQGYAPEFDMVRPAAPGFGVKGTSTLYTYGDDGQKVAAQWVKTARVADNAREAIEEWVQSITEDCPARKPTACPTPDSSQVMACYVMGDPHCGLYAWEHEAGENYNLEKWAREHQRAIAELVQAAPSCDEAVIVNLGDFFHADTDANRTKSGNQLDVDGRRAKVFHVGCETFEVMIQTALEKHKHVTVYITKGNHDEDSAFALAEVLRALYRKEPRVEIKGGIAYREYHTFGANLIGITHGDKAKPPHLPSVMAAEKPQEWGAAKCRRWLVGHFHHVEKKEYPGCMVEIFPTLARNDAWHSGMGYLSEKAMTCLVFDKDHGETGRRIVGITEIAA